MTSKKFFILTMVLLFSLILTVASINYILDDFGLFRSHKERRIWALEKTSKYLMSFKYIPDNYDAVLVGSSVSANLDTRKLTGYKVYNLSMNSGNITELKYPLDVLIRSGKIKAVIFCLYDYTTKNSGVKGNQLDKKEYWGSLYSNIPFQILKYRIKYKLLSRGYDVFEESGNGFNDFNRTKKNIFFEEINRKYLINPRKEIVIDSQAVSQLSGIVDDLHRNGIKIYAFYYPIYKEWYNILKNNGSWDNYKNTISSIFDYSKDTVIDMNEPEYDHVSCSKEVYADGHLSDNGADQVLNVINDLIQRK